MGNDKGFVAVMNMNVIIKENVHIDASWPKANLRSLEVRARRGTTAGRWLLPYPAGCAPKLSLYVFYQSKQIFRTQ